MVKMAEFNGLLRFMTCIFGIGVSVYALYVEVTKLHDKEFKAMCDISETMSCSKVFTSKYVKKSCNRQALRNLFLLRCT